MSHPLSVKEMQAAIDRWITQWPQGYWSPLSNLARLTEELGELARAVNHHHGEKRPKQGEEAGDIALEMADVMFTLMTLANSLGIDLTEALEQAMEKYTWRDGGERFGEEG